MKSLQTSKELFGKLPVCQPMCEYATHCWSSAASVSYMMNRCFLQSKEVCSAVQWMTVLRTDPKQSGSHAVTDMPSKWTAQYTTLLSQGLFSEGLFSKGLFLEGLFSKGLFLEGLFSEGLYAAQCTALLSQGLFSEGLFFGRTFFQVLFRKDFFSEGLFLTDR